MRKLGWIDWLIFIFVGCVLVFMSKSIYGWVNTNRIELFTVTSPLIFPFIVLCGMFVCWILTIIKEVNNAIENKENAKEIKERKEINANVMVAGIYAIGVLVYTLVIEKIGFLYGSIFFLILGMVYMNYDDTKILIKIRSAAIVSIIAVPTLYFIFYKVFNVILP